MSNQIPPEQANDPTFRKYYLNCKVVFFRKTVENVARTMALLVPQEGDETNRFYAAWVPTSQGEHYELAATIGTPVNSPVRLSIHLGHDEKCDRPYLFVMSKGVEDIIVGHIPEGRVLRVTVLPANEEDQADFAQDASDGNFEVV